MMMTEPAAAGDAKVTVLALVSMVKPEDAKVTPLTDTDR